jgi:CheY-like chemotaxis protein
MAYLPSISVGDCATRRAIRLLVVDDQQEHFEQLVQVAEMYHPDFTVECRLVSDPEKVVEVASDWQPSVVLLDLHVVSSALQLVRQISAMGTSVVATSSVRLPELAERISECGGVGYMTKSENPEEVESLLNFVASVAHPIPTSH